MFLRFTCDSHTHTHTHTYTHTREKEIAQTKIQKAKILPNVFLGTDDNILTNILIEIIMKFWKTVFEITYLILLKIGNMENILNIN